jgi:protoporphyrinogen oxidase
VEAGGGSILKGIEVTGIDVAEGRVASITAVDLATGEPRKFEGDFFFSTLPVKELIRSMHPKVPAGITEISEGLMYRDFITVGLLVNKLKVTDDASARVGKLIADNWIYIQEPDVIAGRLQIFNNWSPYMVADRDKVWLGVEYFCNDTDEIWRMPDADMARLAAEELDKIGIIDKNDLLDSTVFRMPKTYPAYFGTYDRFDTLREYIDGFENLFLIGRNGMHKYNNQDHSMLTAMIAVDNVAEGRTCKKNIWSVNTEMDYHEEKAAANNSAGGGYPAGRPIAQEVPTRS